MSDTPRTDAETMRDEYDHVDTEFGAFAPSNTVSADFARQLERELAEANTVSATLLATLLATKCRELAEVTKQRDALIEGLEKLASCDWVITLPDRMDAVRKIANETLNKIKP